MKNDIFLINSRFRADRSRNEVKDISTDQTTKVEPRIIKVLWLLIGKRGEVMTREELIQNIWGDYLGANEALSQAISILRKLLIDDSKEIIQTIPKTGYSFHGIIAQPEPILIHSKPKTKRIVATIFIVLVAVVISVYFFPLTTNRNTKEDLKNQGPPNAEAAAKIAYLDSIHQAEKLKQPEHK